eukprot:TRINITY_DN5101_c0_g1_i1.p1 TRINITY_DN5101_c0_g1~~TRINITY_DN5101_c0_g1_i1.p1  ORF type:complete len:2368 (+),score=849.34 TRINITY_DN5101_c0_g1_i1:79-7104(+)
MPQGAYPGMRAELVMPLLPRPLLPDGQRQRRRGRGQRSGAGSPPRTGSPGSAPGGGAASPAPSPSRRLPPAMRPARAGAELQLDELWPGDAAPPPLPPTEAFAAPQRRTYTPSRPPPPRSTPPTAPAAAAPARLPDPAGYEEPEPLEEYSMGAPSGRAEGRRGSDCPPPPRAAGDRRGSEQLPAPRSPGGRRGSDQLQAPRSPGGRRGSDSVPRPRSPGRCAARAPEWAPDSSLGSPMLKTVPAPRRKLQPAPLTTDSGDSTASTTHASSPQLPSMRPPESTLRSSPASAELATALRVPGSLRGGALQSPRRMVRVVSPGGTPQEQLLAEPRTRVRSPLGPGGRGAFAPSFDTGGSDTSVPSPPRQALRASSLRQRRGGSNRNIRRLRDTFDRQQPPAVFARQISGETEGRRRRGRHGLPRMQSGASDVRSLRDIPMVGDSGSECSGVGGAGSDYSEEQDGHNRSAYHDLRAAIQAVRATVPGAGALQKKLDPGEALVAVVHEMQRQSDYIRALHQKVDVRGERRGALAATAGSAYSSNLGRTRTMHCTGVKQWRLLTGPKNIPQDDEDSPAGSAAAAYLRNSLYHVLEPMSEAAGEFDKSDMEDVVREAFAHPQFSFREVFEAMMDPDFPGQDQAKVLRSTLDGMDWRSSARGRAGELFLWLAVLATERPDALSSGFTFENVSWRRDGWREALKYPLHALLSVSAAGAVDAAEKRSALQLLQRAVRWINQAAADAAQQFAAGRQRLGETEPASPRSQLLECAWELPGAWVFSVDNASPYFPTKHGQLRDPRQMAQAVPYGCAALVRFHDDLQRPKSPAGSPTCASPSVSPSSRNRAGPSFATRPHAYSRFGGSPETPLRSAPVRDVPGVETCVCWRCGDSPREVRIPDGTTVELSSRGGPLQSTSAALSLQAVPGFVAQQLKDKSKTYSTITFETDTCLRVRAVGQGLPRELQRMVGALLTHIDGRKVGGITQAEDALHRGEVCLWFEPALECVARKRHELDHRVICTPLELAARLSLGAVVREMLGSGYRCGGVISTAACDDVSPLYRHELRSCDEGRADKPGRPHIYERFIDIWKAGGCDLEPEPSAGSKDTERETMPVLHYALRTLLHADQGRAAMESTPRQRRPPCVRPRPPFFPASARSSRGEDQRNGDDSQGAAGPDRGSGAVDVGAKHEIVRLLVESCHFRRRIYEMPAGDMDASFIVSGDDIFDSATGGRMVKEFRVHAPGAPSGWRRATVLHDRCGLFARSFGCLGLTLMLQYAPELLIHSLPTLGSAPVSVTNLDDEVSDYGLGESSGVLVQWRHLWKTTRMGYELLVHDAGLSLSHWLCLVGDAEMLRAFLRAQDMRQEQAKGQPGLSESRVRLADRLFARTAKLGWTPGHYAVYSDSVDCLRILMEAARHRADTQKLRLLVDAPANNQRRDEPRQRRSLGPAKSAHYADRPQELLTAEDLEIISDTLLMDPLADPSALAVFGGGSGPGGGSGASDLSASGWDSGSDSFRGDDRGSFYGRIDGSNLTLLHVAAQFCHQRCMKALLHAGANPTRQAKLERMDCHDVAVAVHYKMMLQMEIDRRCGAQDEVDTEREKMEGLQVLKSCVNRLHKEREVQKKLRRKAWWYACRRALPNIIFAIALTVFIQLGRNERNYLAINGLAEGLVREEFTHELGLTVQSFSQMAEVEEFHRWLQQTFYKQMINHTTAGTGLFLGFWELIGAVRFSWLNDTDPNATCGSTDWLHIPDADRRGKCFHGTRHLRPDGSSELQYMSRKTSELWYLLPAAAPPETTVDVNRDPEVFWKNLTEFEEKNMWNTHTRAVVIWATAFNPSIDAVVTITILIEMPLEGMLYPHWEVDIIRPDPYGYPLGNPDRSTLLFYWLFQIYLLLYCIYYTVEEMADIYSVYRQFKQERERKKRLWQEKEEKGKSSGEQPSELVLRRKAAFTTGYLTHFRGIYSLLRIFVQYFSEDWNILDLLSLATIYYAIIAHYICRSLRRDVVDELNEFPLYNGTEPINREHFYVAFTPLKMWLVRQNIVFACAMVVHYIKLLKYVELLPTVGPVVSAIVRTCTSLRVAVFVFVWQFCTMSFMAGLNVMLGDYLGGYRTVYDAFFTVQRHVLSDFDDFEQYYTVHTGMGPVAWLLLTYVSHLLLLNLFIAVISVDYSANLDSATEDWAWQLVDVYKTNELNLLDTSRTLSGFEWQHSLGRFLLQHCKCGFLLKSGFPFRQLAEVVQALRKELKKETLRDEKLMQRKHLLHWTVVRPRVVQDCIQLQEDEEEGGVEQANISYATRTKVHIDEAILLEPLATAQNLDVAKDSSVVGRAIPNTAGRNTDTDPHEDPPVNMSMTAFP